MPPPALGSLEERYGPTLHITDQGEADSYFELLVAQHIQAMELRGMAPLTRENVEAIERSNIGYYAGYFNSVDRERVERLFRCAHPVFGAIATNGQPTPEQAFKMGMEMGQNLRRPTIWERLRDE